METKNLYKVFDIYDGVEHREFIGYANSFPEIQKLANQRYDDTDGEAVIAFVELNTAKNKYDMTKWYHI